MTKKSHTSYLSRRNVLGTLELSYPWNSGCPGRPASSEGADVRDDKRPALCQAPDIFSAQHLLSSILSFD